VREREEKAQKTKRKPRGRHPKPPQPGPRDKDQYNFTDPDSLDFGLFRPRSKAYPRAVQRTGAELAPSPGRM
jgi:hypothetical protein